MESGSCDMVVSKESQRRPTKGCVVVVLQCLCFSIEGFLFLFVCVDISCTLFIMRCFYFHTKNYSLLDYQSRQIELADKRKEAAMAFGGPASPTFKRFRKKITVFVKNFGNYLLPTTQQLGSKYACKASQPPFR